MNLQEANLRSVIVDSNDPLNFSSHSDGSLPSFVATPGVARVGTTPELGVSEEQGSEMRSQSDTDLDIENEGSNMGVEGMRQRSREEDDA